jgi:hypothetical protein
LNAFKTGGKDELKRFLEVAKNRKFLDIFKTWERKMNWKDILKAPRSVTLGCLKDWRNR